MTPEKQISWFDRNAARLLGVERHVQKMIDKNAVAFATSIDVLIRDQFAKDLTAKGLLGMGLGSFIFRVNLTSLVSFGFNVNALSSSATVAISLNSSSASTSMFTLTLLMFSIRTVLSIIFVSPSVMFGLKTTLALPIEPVIA